jgi:hypothetical protein
MGRPLLIRDWELASLVASFWVVLVFSLLGGVNFGFVYWCSAYI